MDTVTYQSWWTAHEAALQRNTNYRQSVPTFHLATVTSEEERACLTSVSDKPGWIGARGGDYIRRYDDKFHHSKDKLPKNWVVQTGTANITNVTQVSHLI